MMWDGLAVRLQVSLVETYHLEKTVELSYGSRALVMPFQPARLDRGQELGTWTLRLGEEKFKAIANGPVEVRDLGSKIELSRDVFSPLAALLTASMEGSVNAQHIWSFLRAEEKVADERQTLAEDYVGQLADLLGETLGIPRPKFWKSIAPSAPYALALTFTSDVMASADISMVVGLADKYKIRLPTLFVPSPSEDENFCCPDFKKVSDLLEEVEIALLSPRRGKRIEEEKWRLEALSKQVVRGYRSVKSRFDWPCRQGHLARAGFQYDFSSDLVVLPGQGASALPMPVADPSGWGGMIWLWGGVTNADETLVRRGWSAETRRQNKALFDHQREIAARDGGVLAINWDIKNLTTEAADQFEMLSWMLACAERDGAFVAGAGQILAQLERLAPTREVRARFQSVAKADLSSQRSGEARDVQHYVKGARAAQLTSVQYIDNGATSFLSCMPPDAIRIADIGCGNGWISNRVPPFTQVLGIDIDQDITTRISRRALVGQLPDLPLEQFQVDLALCTDVIEHLSEQEAIAAGQAFGRVSTRYAYLQTPNRERLEDSQRHCLHCGKSWHINFHKMSHTAMTLASLMPESWYPSAVVYTGECRIVDSSLRDVNGSRLKISAVCAQPFTCVHCGRRNEAVSEGSDERLHQPQRKQQITLPIYSEVALLMANDTVPRIWRDHQPLVEDNTGGLSLLPRPFVTNTNSIDFREVFEEVVGISDLYLVPTVFADNCVLDQQHDGVKVACSKLVEHAAVFLSFSDLHPPGAVFKFHGHCEGVAQIYLEAFDWQNQLSGNANYSIDNDFECSFILSGPAYCFKISIPVDAEIVLRNAGVEGEAKKILCYDLGVETAYSHVVTTRAGIQHRWLVPYSGRLWTHQPFTISGDEVTVGSVHNTPGEQSISLLELALEDSNQQFDRLASEELRACLELALTEAQIMNRPSRGRILYRKTVKATGRLLRSMLSEKHFSHVARAFDWVRNKLKSGRS